MANAVDPRGELLDLPLFKSDSPKHIECAKGECAD